MNGYKTTDCNQYVPCECCAEHYHGLTCRRPSRETTVEVADRNEAKDCAFDHLDTRLVVSSTYSCLSSHIDTPKAL
jgi:hypothetical protein